MTGQRSVEAKQWHKLYSTARWKRLRESVLVEQPLCLRCQSMGVVEVATVVHHREAHRGDETKFYDRDNLEPICKPHHDSEGQREDLGQTIVTFGDDGWPVG